MKASVFLTTALVGLLAVPAVASAQDQPWLKDRRYSEGPGYRVGDFELHPGVAAEFGYDSNFLRRSSDDQATLGQNGATAANVSETIVTPALRFRLTPSLSFSTLGAQRRETAPSTSPPSVEFRGGLSLTYNEYIGISSDSGANSVMNQQRNLGAAADLSLSILPNRPWSGLLSASFARILTPGDNGASAPFSSQGTLNRDVPTGKAELIWTPGAGLLEWRLGYQFTGNLFESQSQLTNLNNQVELRGRWRFLPRTSLLFDGRVGFISYPNPASDDPKTGSTPVRTLIGINGLITPSFALLAMVGWGASFYSTAVAQPSGATVGKENFDSVIGQAEAKWFITPNPSSDPNAATLTLSSISVGFLRDFYDSYIGTYFERDRGYANLSYFYGGRFLLVIDAGAGPLVYPQMPVVQSATNLHSFSTIRVDGSVFGEYRFKDSFGINATFRYNQNFTSEEINVLAPSGVVANPPFNQQHLSFQEFEAYLGARWLM
jgi:hypothetical protein